MLGLLLPTYAAANDLYIAQNAAGAGTGSNCSSPLAYTFFNVAGNWGNAASQIGPGTTVHICGTLTGAANSTMLTFQGDGAPGSPITLLFEANAVLTDTNWAQAGAIYGGSSRNWVNVDGGNNGLIQNTANGSSPNYPTQTDSAGVYFPTCSNCIVRNLTVSNLFVKTTSDSQGGGDAIDIHSGSNNTIYNNLIHDSQIGIIHNFGRSGSLQTGVSIYGNTIYRFNHAIAIGDLSTNSTFDSLKIYGNNIHDAANWDDVANNNFHHNGIFVFTNNSSNHYTNLQIFNNYIYGDFGARETGHIFLDNEATDSNYNGALLFNNILVDNSAANGPSNGFIITKDLSSSSAVGVYNNTMYFTTNVGSRCVMDQGATLTLKNNVNFQCYAVYISSGATSPATDYNDYGSLSGIGGSATLGAWQAACGCDSHSSGSAPNLNLSSFAPNAGSPLVGAGINLRALAAGLSLDKLGTPRPLGSAWDIGAIQSGAPVSGGGGSLVPPPTVAITSIK